MRPRSVTTAPGETFRATFALDVRGYREHPPPATSILPGWGPFAPGGELEQRGRAHDDTASSPKQKCSPWRSPTRPPRRSLNAMKSDG
jgi:hypothetical protein